MAHSLGLAMRNRGHKVTVCCTNQKDHQNDFDYEVGIPRNVEGIEVYYEPVRFSRKWGYSPAMARRLPDLVKEADAVLIHNHFQYAGWIGARVAGKARKPYLTFAHGSLKRDSLRASSGNFKRIYLRMLEHKNLLQANSIAFNADEELEDSIYSSNGIVLPNGISKENFGELPERGRYKARFPKLEGKTIFLFLGRIDIRQKAVDLIVEAFATLAKSTPEAMLVMAGPSEGGDADIIKEQIQRLGIADKVVFTGLVRGSEKKELLRDSDVFLMPSRYEGLSIALLEALASGLPVILSDRAGLHKKVEVSGSGVVVIPEVQAIVDAMVRMKDERFRLECGKSGRELALKEHTWSAIAEKLENILLPWITHL